MVTGEQFAKQAVDGGYIGIPYSKLDCQGFVERVLADCGIRKPNGTVYDWRGSNSMYRNFQQWRGSIKEAEAAFGALPIGCLLYTRKTCAATFPFRSTGQICLHISVYQNILSIRLQST